MPRPQRPARPYRSLEQFRRGRFDLRISDAKRQNPRFWPCLVCCGKGWDYRYEDRDIIEGYKLAPRHRCSHCKDGEGTKEAVRQAYNAAIEAWKEKLARYLQDEAIWKAAVRKLTIQERKVLGV
jgi:hypothetical protein